MGVRIGELFAGYGGLGMGVKAVLGGEVAWVSDIDKGACKVLAHRFPGVPNLGDITTVDWSAVEPVDVLTGGFPCQDVSAAGKRAGIRPGTRSGLWTHFAYAISQLRPSLVVIENVRGLLSARAHSDVEPCAWCVGDDPDGALRAFGAVLGSLAELGYDCRAHGLRAADVGAPHGRFREFITATDADGGRRWEYHARLGRVSVPDAHREGALLPTPRAGDGEKGGPNQRGSSGDLMLPSAVVGMALLPTPNALEGGQTSRSGDRIGEPLIGGIVRDNRWGQYADAIARWEALTRPAPPPTETGPKGNPRLSARFSEWMMGVPDGWITDVPGITRNEALKLAGNGVCPAQAEAALRFLLGVMEGTPAERTPAVVDVPLLGTPTARDGKGSGQGERLAESARRGQVEGQILMLGQGESV